MSLTLSLIAIIVTGLASRGADAQGVGAHLSLTPYPNTTFQINDEVKLDCVVVNGNNAVDYQIQWYINNSLVQTSNNNSGSSTDGAAGVSITNNNGASQLSLQGALKYDLTSVTCNATGISQTLTTLLILERVILECSADSLDSGTVCFICTLSPVAQSIIITYRFSTADNNELVSTDNFTTNLGSQDTPEKCIQAPALGMYDLHIYTVDSFSVSKLGNPAYVIHDITVTSISTDDTTSGTGSAAPTDSTSATDRNTHPVLTLRTWKYRVYLYVAAGLVVLAIILILLFITTCTLVVIKKYRPVNPYDLDEIDPISNPFNTTGKNKKNKTTTKTKKTTSKNQRGGRTVTTTTTTSRTSSGSLNSTSSSFSHTSIELSEHRSSIQKPLETIKESDQDNASVESMYDQLEAQPDNTYEDMQNTAQHKHDLTYEPTDEYKVGNIYT